MAQTPPSHPFTLFALNWDDAGRQITLSASWLLVAGAIAILVGVIAWRWWHGGFSFTKFEIDQAEIGVGNSKFRFRPNQTDRQVAYAIWVELSTRKIGLPIDFEHDVVAEIYDSWYTFFSVTRELLKTVSVGNVRRDSTQAIIKLSIEVLNEGLRPHLTRWQARFRHWYDRELKKYDEGKGTKILDPQGIQMMFPEYEALAADMKRVNAALMKYRSKMRELIMQD